MSNNCAYINEVGGTLIIDLQEDITAATSISINVAKPDGTTDIWYPEVSDVRYLVYTIAENDLNVAGTYYLQPALTLNGWTGFGDAVPFQVKEAYSL